MTDVQSLTAFNAFENQLKTLCLHEFPCGIGRWKENYGEKRKQIEKDKVSSRFVVTLKEYGATHEKTETLEELVISKDSPWNLDYSWSSEAKELREIAVRSPWLIDDHFVHSHFKTLQIVDKDVTEVDESFRQFTQLEELSLSANRIRTVRSTNLPRSLKVLELCANEISNLADLCLRPPPHLDHLGLGYNSIVNVDEYITGRYWPNLLSLDLSHNNLCDMMDIVRKLQSLPKLRNLILQGNPLMLIPGYRGYTIDSLRKLSFLDDISISADEKHHYKGLAKRKVGKGPVKEFILDEAKVVLHVSYIKGLPMPEEMKVGQQGKESKDSENAEEQPEFPVVNRKYYVQFMYPEDKVKDAEIFEIIHDDAISDISSRTHTTETLSINTGQTSEADALEPGEVADADIENQQDQADVPVVMVTQPADAEEAAQRPGTQHSIATTEVGQDPGDKPQAVPGLNLAAINSACSEWAEEIELNWTRTISRDDLRAVRDFFKLGMDISVMEEKVESFPAVQFQEEGTSPVLSLKSKDGGKKDTKADKKADKKDDKGKDKAKDDKASKGGDKGKAKKKGEIDIDMIAMPAEYRTLCSFHVPLADFLDGEFEFENVYSYDGLASVDTASPVSEVSSKNKQDKGKDKDKKKPGSAKKKEVKAEKDARVKSGKKEDKKEKKDDKGKGSKDGKLEGEEEPFTQPPPLEIHVRVKLGHWKTAMDSMKAEESSEKPGADEQAAV